MKVLIDSRAVPKLTAVFDQTRLGAGGDGSGDNVLHDDGTWGPAPDVDAHLTDTTDAHDASAISIVDTGTYFTGTDVEAALQELGAGAGSGGITVDDEGTPLTTTATELDFVGAGVTASGSGATKTISIPGGGGAPTDPVMTDLVVWLDAADITSPPSDGAELTTWDDKSGGSHDFTGSGATRPTYETNEVNGLPVVRFATNDVLEGGDLSGIFPSAASLMIAFRLNVITTSYDLFEDANRDIWWNFGGTSYMGTFKSARVASATPPPPTLGTHIVVLRSGSVAYEWWWDSSYRFATTANYAIGTVAHLGKGQNSSFVGDVLEVLLYDDVVPDATVAENMTYLRDKWAIPT
jgi:hypothetical protein